MANYEFSPVSGDEPCCRISKKCWVLLCLGLLVLIAIPVIVVVTLKLARKPVVWNGPGSTRNLFHIVLSRCDNYTQQRGQPDLRREDCPEIRDAFKNAFISKNPCSVTKEDYEPLVRLVKQTVPCNKSLFWSKTKELAYQFAKVHDMFRLEDTLLGHMADNLNWCGNSSSAELNYENCPRWSDCKNTAVSAFWKAISQKFAESACGEVHVVLNGSLDEPFSKKSVFGSVEVFHFDPKKVNKLQAWVIHDIGQTYRELCESSSLRELKSIVEAQKIKFHCKDTAGLPDSLNA
ncbi:ADP-ribosyl cyclase/cyclic ADP-ribose hydrolase 1 isoform X2 [Cavia porcellus]|uniref:ADP-ribosyl cyclase/cyclic ADP-ribose hydrolase 1 isoform X2 n=1 Tax=Cavia porcellus TaxID=10141 RepID=UPI002FDF7EF7